MEKLFIYYSYSGSGDVVASSLKEQGIKLRKVITKRNLPKAMFPQMMLGGMLAGFKHKSALVSFDPYIDNYEEIIIGSPIWNGDFACPMNSVLSKLNLENKQVTFILYSGSGTAPKAVKRIEKKYPNARYILLKEPKKYQGELTKIKL